MASTLNSHREYGLRVVASIPPSDDIGIAAGSTESKGSIWDPITGPFRDSNSSLSSIRYAILHLEGMPADKIAATLDTYSRFFNRTLLVADLPCGSSFGAEVRDLGGTLGLELPHHLLSSGAQTIKRVCDILVSATLLVLLAPLVALIVTAIKLTSKGPVLYAQSRIGFNGKPLQILKFRTMVLDADAALSEYLRCHPGLRAEWIRDHKLRRDPRVTSIGRYLRKLSLDELPQLWNILKGDMSLVGPRPITSKEIHRYGPQFDLYLRVVPGLTGLWQVSGRNNTTYRERVSYDEFYVRNWSIWMDLHILCLTVKTVLTTDGAY
jgi:Undecaprenyl-phosphate galactose phosphotransferase WbaP